MRLLAGARVTPSCMRWPWSFLGWASSWAHSTSGKKTREDVVQPSDLGHSSGAGSSKGKASWTGKAEVNDYISFIGFLLHYLNDLRPTELSSHTEQLRVHSSETVPSADRSTVGAPSEAPIDVDDGLTLLLGGYSYGSLIVTLLPTTDVTIARFSNAVKGSAAAAIISRAAQLSEQWNAEVGHDGEAQPDRQFMMGYAVRDSSDPVAMDGRETESSNRKASRESGRSLDGLRNSLDVLKRRLTPRNGSRDDEDVQLPKCKEVSPIGIKLPRTSYLLISPLLPPVSTLATMFSKFSVTQGSEQSHPTRVGNAETVVRREKFLGHDTLAVYGDKDVFTSQRKLRKWAEHLACESNSRFQFREIAGAGHFWLEGGVEQQMRVAVREWAHDIL